MSTTAFPMPRTAADVVVPRGRVARALRDGVTITWRNLIGYIRIPQALVFSTVQPVVLVLMFRYVFGGAIQVPGFDYVDFMVPGVFAQAIAFGAVGTAIALAEDMQKGLIERFHSLPMARSAVLTGRTTAELCRNVLVVAIMTMVGMLVGFRYHTSAPAFLAGILVILLFGYALSWVFATVGLTAANAEVAQAKSFPLLFPLIFASSAFVPVDTMPGWLQAFARNQPVSATVDAARVLMLGGPTAEPVLKAVAWSVALLVVGGTIAVRRYRRVI